MRCSGNCVAEAAHEVELGADDPGRAGGRGGDGLDDLLGRAHLVGQLDDLVLALGVHDDLDAGDLAPRAASTASTEKRPCTEQCPRQRIIRASRSCSRVRPPRAVRVPHHAVVEGGRARATAVLRPRCWSGRKSTLPCRSPPTWSNAQSRAVCALDERADRAAVPAGEGLDRGGGVHVGDRDGRVGDAGLDQLVPARPRPGRSRPCRPSSSPRRGRAGSRSARRWSGCRPTRP